jgi:hypothetical protein
VGAGPVGLSAAAELRRHGVRCRLVDRLLARLPYAKAVGIQPRTLEIWDRMGLARAALEAAVPMRGQLADADGLAGAAGTIQAAGEPIDGTLPGAGLEAVAVLARDAEPAGLAPLAVAGYRDAAGEFARLYRPDGPTGFVVRPDGHLGARFPLADTAAALSDYLTALSPPA